MKLGSPSDLVARSNFMLRLEVSPGELSWLADTWVPYAVCPSSAEYLVHVSSAAYLMRQPGFKGFIEPFVEAQAKKYLREAALTFTVAGKTTPADPYPWRRFLTKAWTERAYQVAGMERIYARYQLCTPGVMIADDVGLGKTVQMIGVLCRLRDEGKLSKQSPAVVFTTTSLRRQWADEVARFSRRPWAVSVADGVGAASQGLTPAKARVASLAPGADLYILNYEMAHLPRYAEAAAALLARAGAAVLDEPGKIKNPEAKTTKAVTAMLRDCRYRAAFNATPIENGLTDLYAQLKALNRYAVGNRAQFEERYVVRDAAGKAVRYLHLGEFKTRVAGMYLRRTADDCGMDLPAVRVSLRSVEMGPAQEAAYRRAVGEYVNDQGTGAVARSRIAAVQYAALAADLKDPASESAKLDDLDDLLSGELAGERVVVFTRFARVARFAAARLAAYRPMVIEGSTPSGDRDAARRRFESRDGSGRLLIGTGAMEHGLNLQAAGIVANLDLPWNAAKLRQRVGRVRRIGQARAHVLVINWRARLRGSRGRTIDDWFISLIQAKKQLPDKVFGDDGVDELGAGGVSLDGLRGYLSEGLAAAPPAKRKATKRKD